MNPAPAAAARNIRNVALINEGCQLNAGLDRRFGHFLYRNLSRLRLSLRLILSDAIWKDHGTFNPKFNMAETVIKAKVGLDRRFGHFLYRNLSRLRLLLRLILSDAI